MNPFLVVVDLDDATLGLDALTPGLPALSQSDGRVEVLWNGPWAGAWVPSRHFARPTFIHQHGVLAIGNVRLAGRKNRRTDIDPAADDLAFVVAEYRRLGPLAVRELVGDFAFVLWDSGRRQLLAARDALGVKSLYWQRRGNRLYLASHLDCFEPTGYDRDFLGHFLVGLPSATTRTVYSDVTRLAAGSLLTTDGDRVTQKTYWSPTEFIVERPIEPAEAVTEFRRLFADAVAAQLDDGMPAWSQLSGGLDSSSVVAVAAGLARAGRLGPLAGTVTVVDSLSEGDETRYSDAVLSAYPHLNTRLADYGAWQADAEGPPPFAEPRIFLPFFARDRAMCRAVLDGGARVLLSGYGSDNYLSGPHFYLADLMISGRWGEALRQLTDVAVVHRRSVYATGFENVVTPLAPRWLGRRWQSPAARPAPWLDPRFVRELGLVDRAAGLDQAPRGRGVYGDWLAGELGTIDLSLERGVFDEGLEVRYPFLHRPLVEFALALPVSLKVRPGRQKWILREALKDVLPPKVRDRPGKGGIDARVVWSLSKERAVVDRLVADSRLAELGCLDRGRLMKGLDAARAGAVWSVSPLFITLALETWLAVRSGRWSREVSAGPAADVAVNNSHEGADHVVQ